MVIMIMQENMFFFDTYEEALQEAEKLAMLFNLKKIDYDEYRK